MLTSEQIKSRDKVINKVRTGEYVLIPNPCLCKATTSVILANKDRYDIPVRTVLCLTCGLVRSDPYYDEKTLSDFYDNEYRLLYTGKELATESFFREQEGFGQYIYDFLAKNIFKDEITNKKIFEVGCGAGGILQTFKNRDNAVFGCDYGKDYLEFGKNRGLDLITGGSSSLSQFGKADIVILNHTLEHIPNLQKELDVIRQLLSPSGILYIALPGIYYIHDTYRGRFVGSYLQNAHVWYFTLKTLNATLARSGFQLVAGNEIIMAIYKAGTPNQKTEAENPNKILAYLKKTKNLTWYYRLKKFSPRHTAFETLRRFGPLYRVTRALYRKFKKT